MWPWNSLRQRIEKAEAKIDDLKAIEVEAQNDHLDLKQRLEIFEAQVWWDNNARGYDGHWCNNELLFHGRRFLRTVHKATNPFALSFMLGYYDPQDAEYEAARLNEQYDYCSLTEYLEVTDD